MKDKSRRIRLAQDLKKPTTQVLYDRLKQDIKYTKEGIEYKSDQDKEAYTDISHPFQILKNYKGIISDIKIQYSLREQFEGDTKYRLIFKVTKKNTATIILESNHRSNLEEYIKDAATIQWMVIQILLGNIKSGTV